VNSITQAALILGSALGGAAISAIFAERPAPAADDPFARTYLEVAAAPLIWVDARSPDAFAQEHIPGAINISLDSWESGFVSLLEEWTPDTPIVAYCDGESCQLSREVAERLRQELGVESVYWLEGGIDAWREATR